MRTDEVDLSSQNRIACCVDPWSRAVRAVRGVAGLGNNGGLYMTDAMPGVDARNPRLWGRRTVPATEQLSDPTALF